MIQHHLSALCFFNESLQSLFRYRIPDEHREKIGKWLKKDFKMHIDGKITRSRCLFMVGPTQHGI